MPNLPLHSAHPRGWQNPVTFRASAALAAAGAWDAAPTESFCSGVDFITLSLTYTQGAAGGSFDIQVQGSIYSVVALVPAGAGEWGDESAIAVGAVAGGADTQVDFQAAFSRFDPVGAAAETIVIGPIRLARTYERLRIPAREVGAVGTPGTLAIVAELY